ncbi:MAG: hypothetical protein UY06_C0024G0003 [Candidatus Amesbacteria bacterium GW2011_GWA2_47_70]|nr:MAG: hypothetical protein UY06_C0024G0003 [Candidatus Amesbacteria bacterium GW2011_GWA2_47_70]
MANSFPAWANLNTLSIKNSTSFFDSSRKCSAMVTPASPVKYLTAAFSPIGPKTNDTAGKMPLTFSSSCNSWPSLVRSPTPANTDTLLSFLPRVTTLCRISVKSKVLPTPAPPNSPILPPRTSGENKSMALIPVSHTVASATSSE